MKNIEEPRFIQRKRHAADDERRRQENKQQIAKIRRLFRRFRKYQHAKEKKSDARDNRRYKLEIATLVFVILAFGATSTYVCLTRKQVQLAEAQVGVAKDTEKRQLRAYVFIKPDESKTIIAKNKTVELFYQIRNAGMTPAYRVRSELGPYIQPASAPFDPDMSVPLAQYPTTIVWPGIDNHSSGIVTLAAITSTSGDAKAKLISGELAIYFVGDVLYSDIFGDEHRTDFCYVFRNVRDAERRKGQRDRLKTEIVRCLKHNNAD